MANAKSRKKTKNRSTVKDLKAKDARSVKGGISVTKTTDVSSTNLFQYVAGSTLTTQK